MMYDSLLLNCGGGIINDAQKSPQFTSTAALAIGIGGTGVAALSELKGKIYQQLIPDNPGEPIPRYDGIQLLAIDSDDTDFKRYRGNCRLDKSEFFPISNPHLMAALNNKPLIEDDRLMYWMEIDKINKLLSAEGAGGIRQVGRYLLMSKAAELKKSIEQKCAKALQHRGASSLDIYIFAGISGGTGSGCFLDTCYIVRNVVETNGWNAKIMGYFFLPDVVTSKPEVKANSSSLQYNNSNGYAAMKELDYLMSLKDANDWFEQNYGPTMKVKTQEPPVDMCHLISAQKADGTMVHNGFTYGINVASDYAMAYLADVQVDGDAKNDEKGLTMRGHLANVSRGVQGIKKRWGANLSYHILGASNAEIPMTQINTYLAIGFFKRFQEAMYKPKSVVTKNAVDKFAASLHFIAKDIFSTVTSSLPALKLPDIDPRVLVSAPICTRGTAPEGWAKTGNQWYDECNGKMTTTGGGLMQVLTSYDVKKVNEQSLIGRLFQKLVEISMDPEFGPYYAASLLKNDGYDLLNALEGEIVTARGMQDSTQRNIDLLADNIVECNQALKDRNGRRGTYDNFYQSVTRWYLTNCRVTQLAKTEEILRNFKNQAQELYQNFFKPLCEMLDNLRETFEKNGEYLTLPEAKETNAYTWQILTLDDIKPKLDLAVENLTVKKIVNDFIEHLLVNSEAWLKNDQDNIALMIKTYMLDLFRDQTDRNLESYLYDKFPTTKNDPKLLAQEVESNILDKVNKSAVPMFWCDGTYQITNPNFAFESSSLSVPSICASVCSAADKFATHNASFTVRKVGISDRIFALRFISGIPLFAYQGITLLKDDYDRAAGTDFGVGSHLYAYTGRGNDGSGEKDWRNFLPTPMPYSRVSKADPDMIPEGEAAVKLYKEGVECGVIGIVPKPDGAANDGKEDYAVFETSELQLREYTRDDFTEDGQFIRTKFDAEVRAIQDKLASMRDHSAANKNCRAIALRNDGEKAICDVTEVRMDYFIHYPMLHRVVRSEIAKVRACEQALVRLNEIKAEYDAFDTDLKKFCNLIFYRLITCADGYENVNYDKIAYIFHEYQDKYGDTKKNYLSIKKNEMPYAAGYPLYQAFLNYRAMDPKKSPRLELDTAGNEAQVAVKKESDTLVAAIFEKLWNGMALEDLKEGKLKKESAEDQQAIMRFYNGLRQNVIAFKDEMPSWPRNMSIDQLMDKLNGKEEAQQQAAQDPNQPVWVHYNGENLALYPNMYRNFAWSAAKNQWIALNAQMYVWANNQWQPIKLDPAGNIIL